MKTVVVGGHSRNIGKTSVVAGLIRALREQNWTAVKITQYGHGVCSHDGEPCACAPAEHAFVLTEESNATGRGDTSRFLRAGARRALWLRVRDGQLEQAMPQLEEAWAADDFVMIESNSILNFIEPSVYLAVLDPRQTDFKPSAFKFLARADAFVVIHFDGAWDARAWPAIDPRLLESKRRFTLPAGRFDSPQLCQFVRDKLLNTPPAQLGNYILPQGKEPPCPR